MSRAKRPTSNPTPLSPVPRPAEASTPQTWPIWLAAGLICVALLLAYANSFKAPFVFDDIEGISNNPSIRDLSKLGEVLWAPASATGAVGRPWVNLSLAINYAIGGVDVRGYHLFNLLVHMASALALFGLVRRTLLLPDLRVTYARVALPVALSVALLWSLHPLLTESVTCVIQRTELLGGIFYLLTLYAFVQSVETGAARFWAGLSVAACLLGMGAKEIVATVPVVVFFFDRAFVAGSFSAAWKQRKGYYLALMATWIPLLVLVLAAKNRGGIVGFGLGMSPIDYALTQCDALVLYLKLAFWPATLIMDYGAEVASGPAAVWWQGLVVLALLGATVVALVRWPKAGFLGLTYFVILAPSSSFLPLTTQTMAEHRMYLSLIALIALIVPWLFLRWGNWALIVTLSLALAAGVRTVSRNEDYRSALEIWRVTVQDWPENARSRLSYGTELDLVGRTPEAITQFQKALTLKPAYADAAYNLGNAFSKLGQFAVAADAFGRALELKPKYAKAHYALSNCLVHLGRVTDAIDSLKRARELQPSDPDTLHALASTLAYAGRGDEAVTVYQAALALTPNDPLLHGEFGGLLAQMGRRDEAIRQLQEAVRLAPGEPRWRYYLNRL